MNGFWDWLHARRRREDDRRSRAVLATLLQILPDDPYQYRTAPSFLQPSGALDPLHPVTLDLFFSTRPLAVRIGTRADRAEYPGAQRFIRRACWEAGQAELAWIRERLGRYGCPYLFITADEPLDLASLTARVRMLVGR
jgi:hypothetical protein